jgi:CheY-like chemotaxis protein
VARTAILVIDGDAERRVGLAGALTGAGWRDVRAVASIAEAVAAVRAGHLACAVLAERPADVSALDGIPILRAAAPAAKVIFVADRDDERLEARARALDVFYYHVAADGEAELLEAVAAVVGRPRPASAGPPAVLVVGDDSQVLELLRSALTTTALRLLPPVPLAEALRACREHVPQLVIVDLPTDRTAEGLQLCRELRRDPCMRHAALVALTSHPLCEDPLGRQGDEDSLLPVDLCQRKPLDLAELLPALRRLLEP